MIWNVYFGCISITMRFWQNQAASPKNKQIGSMNQSAELPFKQIQDAYWQGRASGLEKLLLQGSPWPSSFSRTPLRSALLHAANTERSLFHALGPRGGLFARPGNICHLSFCPYSPLGIQPVTTHTHNGPNIAHRMQLWMTSHCSRFAFNRRCLHSLDHVLPPSVSPSPSSKPSHSSLSLFFCHSDSVTLTH